MAIISRNEDNDKLHILYPVQKRDGTIQMKKLKSFKSVQSLSRQLKPQAWDRLVEQLQQKYPKINVDWAAVHRQATLIVEGPLTNDSEVDQRALSLRQDLSNAAGTLSSLRFSKDQSAWDVLQRGGEELQRLIRIVAVLVEQYRHPDEEQFGLYQYTDRWNHLVANAEASFELVEEARAYFRNGNRKRAKALLQQARELDPFDPDIDNSEGVLLLEADRHDQAEPLFRKAIELARHRLPLGAEGPWCWSMHEVRPLVRALSNLAQIYRDKGRSDDAIRLWEECMALCPDNPLYCDLELAGCYLRRGEPAKALPYLHFAQTSMIGICDAHFTAAIAHLALGQTEDGIKEMLRGMLTNVYVAPKLLKKKLTPRTRHWSNVADPEWATDYVKTAKDLWDSKARALLKALYEDHEVASERDGYLSGGKERDHSLLRGARLKGILKRSLERGA